MKKSASRERPVTSWEAPAKLLDEIVLQEEKSPRWKRWLREGAVFASGLLFTGAVAVLSARPSYACTDGETQPCILQEGVCEDSQQTCSDGEWQACDAPGYQALETFCDGKDNDCDGLVDIVDLDGDGYGACSRPGVQNELLITGLSGDDGSITIFEYLGGAYQEVWSTFTDDGDLFTSGGEVGDLTGDGIPEIALIRARYGLGGKAIEVWTPSAPSGWSLLWQGPFKRSPFRVGAIADFDNDGINELLITDETEDTLDLYSWDGNGFSIEATVRDCAPFEAHFMAAGGDLDNDGTPEIFFQCWPPEGLIVYEYANGEYPIIASIPLPLGLFGGTMKVDDFGIGDVNHDGIADAVFCGNSGQGHVLTYRNGTYRVDFSTPQQSGGPTNFAQACSVGDMTNDGNDDFLVINQLGPRVFTYDGSSYGEVWVGEHIGVAPGINESFVGDPDNDGFTEFLFQSRVYPREVQLYENDTVGATDFQNTHSFSPVKNLVTIIIANLNPANDEPPPIDCDDADPTRGAGEHCGVDYSRPAAGSGGGVGGTHWSDEFTVCNTAAENRELLFRFTERGDPGQPTHTRAETILADACVTFTDPVQEWFGQEMYGAFLIDVMDGPADDIKISGIFKGELNGKVMGQFFGNVALEDAITGDAYILTTTDPERDRLGTGFQATKDGTSLEVTLENPIGTVHWRNNLGGNWVMGDNDLFSEIERHAPGVPNLIIHYDVMGGAVPFGTVTDNQSGDPAARLAAMPSEYLVIPVIGTTSGAAGVDWRSEFTIANMVQEPNAVLLNFYHDGQLLTGGFTLAEGEVLGYGDLVSQITWRDADGSVVPVDQGVGALEIIAEGYVIAGSKFNSVNRETGEVMGLSLKAMAEPNLLPEKDYLFLGVRNEDETGIVRARLNFTNLTDRNAKLLVDVLDQDGELVGSFERTARAKQFNDWRIPRSITEEGETYTLRMTSSQPGYAFVSQMNESNDAICNYPLEK